MIIGGLQRLTLLDYPDEVACVVFTAGCNLRCRFCHNPELVLPGCLTKQSCIPQEKFFTFLRQRRGLLSAVVISGGEPTLQKDLAQFCKQIKELGFLVKLDTNGSNPETLISLVESGLVDYVAMDIKADASQWSSLLGSDHTLDTCTTSICYLLQDTIPYEFRSTLMKPVHTREVFETMVSMIQGAKRYYLQPYRPQKTLDPNFDAIPLTREEMEQFVDYAKDYVDLCMIR